VTIDKVTFSRWLSATQHPRSDAATVLEYWLGFPIKVLLGPAPTREILLARTPHEASLAAAHTLDVRFDSSSLSVTAPVPGTGGVWQMDGLRLYDGTQVAVQMYEASAQDDSVVIGPEDLPHLRTFTRPPRRAMLLGALGAQGVDDLYVLDAAHARRRLAMAVETLPIPAEYRVDDLTFGLVWAMLNLDDNLLADDHVLHDEQQHLEIHLSQRRSAVARAAFPELSAVGGVWLGSHACATYVARHLDTAGAPPLLWSRAQFGEQAATWLFFLSRHCVLQLIRDRARDAEGAAGAAFCIPEAAVTGSEPYERLLLFLAIALMESYGLTVWACMEPEYAEVDEFVLVPGRRVVVANWLGSEAIWHVNSTDDTGEVHAYTQIINHARTHNIMAGPTPAARLRALADYLGLPWAWVIDRCRVLGLYGIAGLLRARNRLIQTSEIDRLLRYLGDFQDA
jgi:hypothetical protein